MGKGKGRSGGRGGGGRQEPMPQSGNAGAGSGPSQGAHAAGSGPSRGAHAAGSGPSRGAHAAGSGPSRGAPAGGSGHRDLAPPVQGVQNLSLGQSVPPQPQSAGGQPRAWGPPRPTTPAAVQPTSGAPPPRLPVGMAPPGFQPRPPGPLPGAQAERPVGMTQQSEAPVQKPGARGPPQKVSPESPSQHPQSQQRPAPAGPEQRFSPPAAGVSQQPQQRAGGTPERRGAAGPARPSASPEKLEKPGAYSKGTYNKYIGTLATMKPPDRPDRGGTLGRNIKLWANHFTVRIGNVRIAYHYDVEVFDGTRPMANKAMRRKIVHTLLNDTQRVGIFPKHCCAFDGMKNIYTSQRLNISDRERFPITVRDDDRDREFAVEVQYAADVDLTAIAQYLGGALTDIPQRAIQCMDIVLRYNQAYNMGYLPVQSSLFNPNQQGLVDLGGGALVWSGHYQSVRMGTNLVLNVDSSQKAVFKDGNVVDVMYDVLELDQNYDPEPLQRWQIEKFAKHLKGLKVEFRVGNVKREYRVNGIKGAANTEKFDNEGKIVTVEQYFKQKYNTDLKYPHLQCLWVGNPAKNNLLPMEFCTIKPGQIMRGKLSDVQTSNMIKVAAKPPAERRKIIEDAVTSMNVAKDPVARNFGFTMADQMTKVMGRVLPPPILEYQGNNKITPRDGKWDMRSAKFLESAGLQAWGVLDTARSRDDQLTKFLTSLKGKARQMGMAVEDEMFRKSCRDQPNEVEGKLQELKMKYPNLKLVLVPIGKKGAEIYKDIKRVGDLLINVTTQCVVSATIFKCQDQSVANLLMKINAKLGGVNNYIDRTTLPKVLFEPVLILGADVTHPAPEARREGKPSIAAVVGSTDARAMKYSGELRLQDPGREIIEELEDMVYSLLRKFYERNRSFNDGKPRKIIFYRDGVSEGQFAEVLRWELNAVRRACQRMERDYSPQITFLVVQKRHNTRLFAERGEPTVGKMGNIPPGTVVDTLIVHKREFAYFLCSHEGIQGTSRPTHYHVLHDENEFTSDTLETLTYYLCHLFARCTRSVSNPAPSYYAHLLAFRGRHHHDSMIRSGQANPQQLITMVERSSRAEPMFYT